MSKTNAAEAFDSHEVSLSTVLPPLWVGHTSRVPTSDPQDSKGEAEGDEVLGSELDNSTHGGHKQVSEID